MNAGSRRFTHWISTSRALSAAKQHGSASRSKRWLRTVSEAVPRALALFFGTFTLLNILGEFSRSGFDANIWWIDLAPLPSPAASAVLFVIGCLLMGISVRPRASRGVLRLSAVASALLICIAAKNALTFYRLKWDGSIESPVWVPMSLIVAAALLIVASWCLRAARQARSGGEPNESTRRDIVVATLYVTAGLCVAFPLSQMVCFGLTDYRQQADAAIVFGCKAYSNGQPSTALADRVATGCELYHAGLVDKLVFSGGPGVGEIHETEAMRRHAVSLGVPTEHIICDEYGLSTQETADNTGPLLERREFKQVLAVSHFYHLPRIKLCFRRAGLRVRTVPCQQPQVMPGLPRYIAREVAAFWWYYARPLVE